MSVLVLGGTAEGRALATELVEAGVAVVTSLAGRVSRPRLPVGEVRVGGFGGVDGLVAYLRERRVPSVVDATHPFAVGISRNAAEACRRAEVPLLRLERPSWADTESAASWHWVDDHDDAATVTARLGRSPFLTVGRQPLDRFVEPLREHEALVRLVEPPEIKLPPAWRMVLSRGPYGSADERAIMADVDVLVTKDSGGVHTETKLLVAAERAVPVVVVRRIPPPIGVEVVSDVAIATAWVRKRSPR